MKIISLVISLVIVSTALCGCGTTSKTANVDKTSNTSYQEEIDISIFKEVETSSENVDIYRKEVNSRLDSLKEDESFINDEDWDAISNSEWLTDSKYRHNAYFTTFNELYEETYEYYYPVVFRDGHQLILWYTTESGYLGHVRLFGVGTLPGSGTQIHYNSSSHEEILKSEANYTVTYAKETGEVKVWEFGEVFATFTGIPANSEYCGFSRFEGYIFRSGTDVYSLNAIDTHNADGSVVCIAHNVQYVIDADYYYGSDPWCQPLFIMTDGSVKAYIGWEGDQDTPDSTTHLCDLQYEGSWDK